MHVFLRDDKEELLDNFLFVNVIIVIPHHLLHQARETESEVVDTLSSWNAKRSQS